jgi:transcriptional regulator with XRE-family HTH domain
MNEREIMGKNLRTHGQAKGLRQKDLATRVGLSVDAVSKIELGKQENIGIKYLVSICQELDIGIEELFLENPRSLRIEPVISNKNVEP